MSILPIWIVFFINTCLIFTIYLKNEVCTEAHTIIIAFHSV